MPLMSANPANDDRHDAMTTAIADRGGGGIGVSGRELFTLRFRPSGSWHEAEIVGDQSGLLDVLQR